MGGYKNQKQEDFVNKLLAKTPFYATKHTNLDSGSLFLLSTIQTFKLAPDFLLGILSNLDTSQSKAVIANTSAKPKGEKTTSFTSARQRKAAAAALKRAEKLKKGKNKLNKRRKRK